MAIDSDVFYDVTLLSIRTAGCRARIVLTTDLNRSFDPHFARVIALTWTEVWRYPRQEDETSDLVRHRWIRNFLIENLHQFDHVFMMDPFDCYFHRDPFEKLSFGEMAFLGEGWPISIAGINVLWIQNCFNLSVFNAINQFEVLCCGTIYGPLALFLEFEDILLKNDYWEHCPVDQPILSVLVYTVVLKSRGIPYRLMSCLSPVLTLSNCQTDTVPVDGTQEILNSDGVVPHVVHQWKAFPKFAELYTSRCNMSKFI
jgi:hypothetical protein